MGKGRDSLHPREGEMGSSLPKQLVTQTDTSASLLQGSRFCQDQSPDGQDLWQLGVPDYTPLYKEQLLE